MFKHILKDIRIFRPASLFALENDSLTIQFDTTSLAAFGRYRQIESKDVERGGLLFAPSVGADNGVVRIQSITPPHAADETRRKSVRLDHGRCLSEIATHFQSGQHLVGYWHSHPQKIPKLSTIDSRVLSNNLVDGGWELKRILAVVVGTESIAVYCINANYDPVPLSPVYRGVKQ